MPNARFPLVLFTSFSAHTHKTILLAAQLLLLFCIIHATIILIYCHHWIFSILINIYIHIYIEEASVRMRYTTNYIPACSDDNNNDYRSCCLSRRVGVCVCLASQM